MTADALPSSAEIRRAFVGLCLAMLLSALDQTIVAAAFAGSAINQFPVGRMNAAMPEFGSGRVPPRPALKAVG